MNQKHLFSAFDVSRQVFYRTPLSFGIVNLKPLLPGHVLICPRRVVPRLADLEAKEVTDLFLAVQHVGRVLEGVYKAKALTVSLQDGAAAGQSVPHVHIHIIPRHPTNYDGDTDQIYPLLEESESNLSEDMKAVNAPGATHVDHVSESGSRKASWPKDEDRRSRSMEEMEKEADWLAGFFA
ncbi:hypothetical protein IAU60_001005 [Kwoniella sp. DSM 27419]